MIASEARAARIALGLSEEALAAETNTTPAIVGARETGRIKVPRQIAVDLTWRMAQVERFAALENSGLPECSWVAAFAAEPEAEKLRAHNARVDRFLAHRKECEICKAREAYIADRFPPMPPAPRDGWVAIVLPIARAGAAIAGVGSTGRDRGDPVRCLQPVAVDLPPAVDHSISKGGNTGGNRRDRDQRVDRGSHRLPVRTVSQMARAWAGAG